MVFHPKMMCYLKFLKQKILYTRHSQVSCTNLSRDSYKYQRKSVQNLNTFSLKICKAIIYKLNSHSHIKSLVNPYSACCYREHTLFKKFCVFLFQLMYRTIHTQILQILITEQTKGFYPAFNDWFLLGHFNTRNSIPLVCLVHRGTTI